MSKCLYKNKFGRAGELLAKDYLIQKGYKFIKANHRQGRCEIDLIFIDETKKILIFVEVKSRRNKKFGEPEESITPRKVESIIKAAEGFAAESEEFKEYDLRIDTVTLLFETSEPIINHIENAV